MESEGADINAYQMSQMVFAEFLTLILYFSITNNIDMMSIMRKSYFL